MQYSGAQNIIPVSKDNILTPDVEPDVQGEEPEVEIEEPEVQGEDEGPTDKGGEPEVQGEDDLTTKDDETESEDQPEPIDPRKGVPGGLLDTDTVNTTQQTLPPAFKIKIIFEAIKQNVPETYEYAQYCRNFDIGMYVQGKLVRLSNINEPLRLCGAKVEQLKNAEAFVEIPGESVESITDFQPLSIFSAGSTLKNCIPKALPADLPEVRKILDEKRSTSPYFQDPRQFYYPDAVKEIYKIQKNITNGCTPTSGNVSLAYINYVSGPPSYAPNVPAGATENSLGLTERTQVNSCSTYRGPFCLFYTIECPICAAETVKSIEWCFQNSSGGRNCYPTLTECDKAYALEPKSAYSIPCGWHKI